MTVRIGEPEEMSAEEFDALRRRKAAGSLDPNMTDVLNRVEAGQSVRVPVEAGQSPRGVRISVGRRAAQRGLRVETVEGDGFVGVRRVEEPAPARPKRESATGGPRKRGRPARQRDGAELVEGTPVGGDTDGGPESVG